MMTQSDGKTRPRDLVFSTISRPSSRILVDCVSLMLVLLLCWISLAVHNTETADYGSDLFIALDGAWRVLCGQRPHIDFYSAFGPLAYLIGAAGLALAHFTVRGLAYATTGVGVILGLWTIALSRNGFSLFARFAILLFVVTFWLAPFPIGEPFYISSYAMQYNRLGYLLVCFVVLDRFAYVFHPERARWFGFTSSAVALGLLLFLKISFFGIGAVLFLIGLLARRPAAKEIIGVVFAFCAVSCVFLSYLGWHIGPMLGDIGLAAHAREARLLSPYELLRVCVRNMAYISSVCALLLVVVTYYLPGPQTPTKSWIHVSTKYKLCVFGIVILLSDLAIASSNAQKSGFPLCIVAVILLADVWCRERSGLLDMGVIASCACISIFSLVNVLPTISDTCNAWAMEVASRRRPLLETERVSAGPLHDMRFIDHEDPTSFGRASENGQTLVRSVDDGLQLLRANSKDSDRIACLCFSNPFSYALSRLPQKGGATFYDYGVNFTSEVSPSPDRILGDASIVIYPKYSAGRQTDALLGICASRLKSDFARIAESEGWVLLRRVKR
jgi:hypothetical protein